MNRKKTSVGGFESLVSKSKHLFNTRMTADPNGPFLSATRFRGKLGAAIAVITSLIVGFLTIPNNIMYFIDSQHSARTTPSPSSEGRPDYEYAYMHAGVVLIALGCLAMVESIVLSYFAAKSKRKMDEYKDSYRCSEFTKSTRTVLTCLIMMNVELFMAVIAGCMELLYRPLISDTQRLHNMECAIAVFNLIIYVMYVVTMALTSTVLKGKHERIPVDFQRDIPDEVTMPSSARDYMSRSINPYNPYSSFV